MDKIAFVTYMLYFWAEIHVLPVKFNPGIMNNYQSEQMVTLVSITFIFCRGPPTDLLQAHLQNSHNIIKVIEFFS